ncbi:hemagglutinin repeat-containing protein [Xanthomonas euvesicatoria]|uniref:hemagglutinin repeat-containing protein n=1 Tax=Xanthomonas euvesicatoria TaxID=456327 RepID=UPI001E4CD4A2|nr:hemagglutinin repeat-containing protein [Xanthomonas euvesicatoria]
MAAGGNLTLLASDGSITSQGTQMSAEGNAVLLASKDIVFDVRTTPSPAAMPATARAGASTTRPVCPTATTTSKAPAPAPARPTPLPVPSCRSAATPA